MADKIVVLNAGIVEQVGSPLELYHRPRNMFVAGFIGSPEDELHPAPWRRHRLCRQIELRLPGGGRWSLPGHRGTRRHGTSRHARLPARASRARRQGGCARLTGNGPRSPNIWAPKPCSTLTLADGSEFAVKADGLAKAAIGAALTTSASALAACHLFDAQAQCHPQRRPDPLMLGVCYYPEHWPEAWWAEDARRMREAGITYVRIGEFAWSRYEPDAGSSTGAGSTAPSTCWRRPGSRSCWARPPARRRNGWSTTSRT